MPAGRPRSGLLPLRRLISWLWLVGCAAAPPVTAPGSAADAPVYVASNGWHTEVVLEAATLPAGRWPQRAPLRDHRYLEVGWGDRDAYPADRLTVGLALRAALVSRGSVLRISGFDEPIPDRFRGLEVVELRVSGPALAALVGFIEASHAADAEGRSVPLGPAPGGVVTFYLARDRFHALNTCNSWTARALQAAGFRLRPALTLTAHQLMLQVAPLGRVVPTGPA